MPGLILPGVLGIFLMVGGIFWAMIDIWPTPDFTWSMEVIRPPLWEMLQTLGLVFVFGLIVTKFLPQTPIWKNLVLSASIRGSSAGTDNLKDNELIKNLIGKQGLSVSELFPGGQVEINGKRYDARSNLGKISKGEVVEVIRNSEFELVVKPIDS